MYGIYGYKDINGNWVYIGVDKHIKSNKRHEQHLENNKLKIDKWLKSNEYKYTIILELGGNGLLNDNKLLAHKIETLLIKELKPLLNERKNYD